MSYDSYKEGCLAGNIQTLADILEIEPYKDEKIAVTFQKFFEAILSPDTGIKPHIVHDFVSKCQNKKDAIIYYLKNPNKIYEDLDFKD